jgi:hypothetical protein
MQKDLPIIFAWPMRSESKKHWIKKTIFINYIQNCIRLNKNLDGIQICGTDSADGIIELDAIGAGVIATVAAANNKLLDR